MARAFSTKGFRIALASRTLTVNRPQDALHIAVDLSKPENVPYVFKTVREELGSGPSVVVYNCKSAIPPLYAPRVLLTCERCLAHPRR